MQKIRNKKVPFGGYQPCHIIEIGKSTGTNHPNYWKGVRPIPYYGFFNRLKHAWNVLRFKADALYWTD